SATEILSDSQSKSEKQNSTSLASASSTTGPRATFNPGNTSPWVHFWLRTSRRPSHLGSFQWKHLHRIVFPSQIGPKATRCPSRTCPLVIQAGLASISLLRYFF